ncbi:hypothetical protein QBC40DRAFT_310867 [Triangularia verruculosa]|uniref:Uncharacterized protein n=1 Tax=Triangularia verruculosa TaxID=2587418 RepID=A0AAN6XCA5_9PEZI|nr:hypothetical protein QBC40DRAFT_310867 [Triangularia verruculosa]
MAATRIQPKRKAAEPPQTQPDPKRVVSKPRQPAKPTTKVKVNTALTDSQDTKDLYLKFRNRYDANPPLNQVRGIWRFINQIKNPDLAKHLQESLVLSLPEYVKLGTRGRPTTQVGGPQRIFVTISVHMTWKRFAEAFDHYAALYLKE